MAHFQHVKTRAQKRRSSGRDGRGDPVIGYRRSRQASWERGLLIKKQGGQCARCGRQVTLGDVNAADFATIDHVVPVSRGGSDALSNKQVLCRACNESKGATCGPVAGEAPAATAIETERVP